MKILMTARERETLEMLKREMRVNGGRPFSFQARAAQISPPDEASMMMVPTGLTARLQNQSQVRADDIAEQSDLANIRRGRLTADYNASMRLNSSLTPETDPEPVLSVSAQLVELAARRRAQKLEGRPL